MKVFKVSKLDIITQIFLLLLLGLVAYNELKLNDMIRIILLSIVSFILLANIIGALKKKVIIDGNNLTVITFFKKAVLEIDKIEYFHKMSPLTKYVVILNDGKKTGVITSQIKGFYDIFQELSEKTEGEMKEGFDSIDQSLVISKVRLTYISRVVLISIATYVFLKGYLFFVIA